MREASDAGKEVGPGVRYVAPENVDPAIAATRREAEARAHRQLERDAEAASLGAGSVRFAITTAELPGGAVAIVVRDPSSRTPRLVVFSERTLDDAAFVLADMALRRDEQIHARNGERRVLLVARDQSVRSGAGADLGALGLQNVFSGSRHFAARLLDDARAQPETFIAGVGNVRVVSSP